MSTPDKPDPTETFTARKVFGGARASVARIDTHDRDRVFDLASALRNAGPRRLMAVTHGELRAIARLAAECAVVASQATLVVELLDRGASRGEIMAQLEQLAVHTRPMMVRA